MHARSVRKSFPSSLEQINPSEALGEAVLAQFSQALDLIFEGREDEVSGIEMAQIIYLFTSFRRSDEILNLIQERFHVFVNRYVTDKFQEAQETDVLSVDGAASVLREVILILPLYSKIERSLTPLHEVIEGLVRSRDAVGATVLKEDFLNALNESPIYSVIMRAINFLFEHLLLSPEGKSPVDTDLFKVMLLSQELLKFASPERVDELKHMLQCGTQQFIKRFLENHELVEPEIEAPEPEPESHVDQMQVDLGRSVLGDDDSGLIENREEKEEKPAKDIGSMVCDQIGEYAKQLLALAMSGQEMAERLFGEDMACAMRDSIWMVVCDPSCRNFHYCVNHVGLMLEKRRLYEFGLFMDTLGGFHRPLDTALEKVFAQLDQESREFEKLEDTVKFYLEVGRLFPHQQTQFEKQITNYVNKDSKKLLAGLVLKVHSIAQQAKPDLTPISHVLEYFSDKPRFDLEHLRFSARRLTRYREPQIEKEWMVLNQLRDISSKFELADLKSLIHQAEKSCQLHLGPVLLINMTMWPYKPPHPSPLQLNSIAAGIGDSYKKIHPSHVVRFPINYWIVQVMDTCNRVSYECTGVQAEVFLHLNTHKYISDTMLEPQIPSSFLQPALESMEKGVPVLACKDDSVYVLNENYRPPQDKKLIKLKVPKAKKEVDKTLEMVAQKFTVIQSEVCKKMKTQLIMKLVDLERYVREACSNRFTVTKEDMRKALEELKTRGYLEDIKNGKIKYKK